MVDGDGDGPRCFLSHPALTYRNLSMDCNSIIPLSCFTCGRKYTVWHHNYLQFYCTTCDVEFHERYYEHPMRITHPYHLQHPLTLFYRDVETGNISNIILDANPCEPDINDQKSDTTDQGKYKFVHIVPSKSDIIFDKCTWCGKDFEGDWFYCCLICSFCLDLPCARSLPPLTIANPKGHHHSLIFLPRPLLVPCDACGLVNALEPSYACFQCNYMAHQSCIDLPRVIKITRHPHRLHYIPFRSPMSSLCRICYKKVDVKYGQYSCDHEGCVYVAHSKCATHVTVWNGKELEWEPEESEDDEEDITPFKKLGDGFIEHFGHDQHPLKLKKHNGGVVDTEKLCEACVSPIASGQFYDCEECDYSLHEVCAGLPKKLDHALSNQTLFLDPSPPKSYLYMTCHVCSRVTTGFRYVHHNYHMQGGPNPFIDVRCVSFPECFTHKSHADHPVFISTFTSNKDCKGCKKRCSGSHLECVECEYALCYQCATIPDKLHYKYDKHPLTLSYGEENISAESDDVYWCEVCEKLLDPKEWFYTCDEYCCTTVHLQCVFGSSFFMKPGSEFSLPYKSRSAQVIRNSSNTRERCYICDYLCTSSIYYEGYEDIWLTEFSTYKGWTSRVPICSWHCLAKRLW